MQIQNTSRKNEIRRFFPETNKKTVAVSPKEGSNTVTTSLFYLTGNGRLEMQRW